MKTAMLVGVVLILSGCAHSDDWTRRDTVLQVAVTGLMIADGVTTSRIKDCEWCYEQGPMARHALGRQPSDGDTAIYFTTLAVSSYFIARALPEKWRPYYQGFVILDHGIMLHSNCEAGLC